MEKETLEALIKEIKLWECICLGLKVDEGPDNCPLCVMFYDNECNGCPVEEETNINYCRDTSYFLTGEKCDENTADSCEEMLEFLISLLPNNISYEDCISSNLE